MYVSRCIYSYLFTAIASASPAQPVLVPPGASPLLVSEYIAGRLCSSIGLLPE